MERPQQQSTSFAGRTTVRDVSSLGAQGDPLAATLELPAGRPTGFAIMAHCFTCTSDTHATARISGALAERGFAVMRFDFTGLGRSGGDFADTTFTSNVGDLVAAADWMRQGWGEVGLVLGHSFGGAAVIAAAGRISTVRAVVTIGAPACPAHVRHLFSQARPSGAGEQRVEVDIGGRPFVLGQDFLDDIGEQPQLERLRDLGAALLVLHSPVDQVVGIDEARQIFDAARHPKSFVALDGADHLLSDRVDTEFAAEVISAWAGRYLPELSGPGTPVSADTAAQSDGVVEEEVLEGVRVTEASPVGGYAHVAEGGRHTWVLDEPTSAGGQDSGPDPYLAVLSALGACTSMTMRMYARRKGWDYGATTVQLRHSRIHAKDCQECEATEGRVERIDRTITVDPALTDEQREALLRIADKCPVHRTLTGGVEIFTDLEAGPGPA